MTMKKGISLYFGDAQDMIFPKDYQNLPVGIDLLTMQPYAKLVQEMELEKLFFLRQVHGVAGAVLKVQRSNTDVQEVIPEYLTHDVDSFTAFSGDGDYLITNVPRVGVGIMTADCLPLVLHDPASTQILKAAFPGASLISYA